MIMVFRLVCGVVFSVFAVFANTPSGIPFVAPESVREAQEELRKRNLFFGDIDGQVSAHLTNALKKYQARKGFEVTGTIDAATKASLQIQSVAADPAPAQEMASAEGGTPAVAVQASTIGTSRVQETVLAAESVSATQSASTQEAAAELVAHARGEAAWADLPITPEPPAEAPTPPDLITPERVNRFVETYLADGETDDIGLQVWFYSFPVRYFNHGLVDQNFVVKDTQAYVKRWPNRKYKIVGPINFQASPTGETQIDFTIEYTVRNGSRTKSGRTKNFWTVRTTDDEMKIIAIREEHIGG